jgi:hypothetical protein
MKYIKYPKTFHLPWSEGLSNDDKRIENIDNFIGRRVIVTEKLDGENTTLYSDYLHARSIDSKHHPSRSWIKKIHSEIKNNIGNYRICGEYLFATHSIFYNELPNYFLIFSAWENDICISWEETQKLALSFAIPIVPVLYDGIWSESKIKDCWTGISKFGGNQEGYVVRLADSFLSKDFPISVAKYVRNNHVQTDENWMMQPVIKNKLK